MKQLGFNFEVRYIELTQGYRAIVDAADFEWLNQWKWFANGKSGTLYAGHHEGRRGDRRRVVMHRLIVEASPWDVVDHINHNTLDNRRANLRLTDKRGNAWNAVSPNMRAGSFKGVRERNRRSPFEASICVRGRRLHLGSFPDPKSAALAYDRAACEHFGEFAYLNFPNLAA